MILTLTLSSALLCSALQCWPVLIGSRTPTGEYSLTQRLTDDPGYGGDVLQFHETSKSVMAIHRVWVLNTKQKRVERLASDDPKDRVITNGCVNVDPEVYKYLVENFRGARLNIVK